jgi:hypothetical protein
MTTWWIAGIVQRTSSIKNEYFGPVRLQAAEITHPSWTLDCAFILHVFAQTQQK